MYICTKEPTHFSASWHSCNYNEVLLYYKIFISVKMFRFVFVNDPYPAGSFPDIKNFQNELKLKLDSNNLLFASRIYFG